MQVVQAIGAAETKLFDIGAPKRIDGEAAIKLVNVAKDLGVTQYIMVTSLGTGKVGFPASRCHGFCLIQTYLAQYKQVVPTSTAVTLLHIECNCIVSSCWLISYVYPYMCVPRHLHLMCYHQVIRTCLCLRAQIGNGCTGTHTAWESHDEVEST